MLEDKAALINGGGGAIAGADRDGLRRGRRAGGRGGPTVAAPPELGVPFLSRPVSQPAATTRRFQIGD